MRQIKLFFVVLFVAIAHVMSAQAGNDGELGLTDLNASNEGVTYVKVTDVSTLQDGDVVIIVNDEAGKAMSKKGTNNRKSVAITISDDAISNIPDDVELVSLEKTSKLWYLKSTSGYLYAKGSANNLQTNTSTQGNYSKASIAISNGIATILFQGSSSNPCLLQYYSTNYIFNCYKKNLGESPISLYKKTTSSTPAETVSLTIGSTGYASLYYSDKALRVANGLVAYTYKVRYNHLFVSKTYSEGDVIPAATSVVFKGAQGSYSLTVTSNAGEGDANNLLKGSDVDAMTEGDGLFYKLSTYQGKNVGFYWAAENGGPFVSKAHKAYLMVPYSVNAKGFAFDETTGIGSVSMPSPDHAIGTVTYNMVGQRIEGGVPSKGIYIVNGKKVVVR
ncbi:MAG: hypothetical protein IJK87_00835 [Prevotella sp.]|nr:hypothetical protein [Prevotella sp.]